MNPKSPLIEFVDLTAGDRDQPQLRSQAIVGRRTLSVLAAHLIGHNRCRSAPPGQRGNRSSRSHRFLPMLAVSAAASGGLTRAQ